MDANKDRMTDRDTNKDHMTGRDTNNDHMTEMDTNKDHMSAILGGRRVGTCWTFHPGGVQMNDPG